MLSIVVQFDHFCITCRELAVAVSQVAVLHQPAKQTLDEVPLSVLADAAAE
jgi:hypothetical protein